jgi:hypothetical protein
MAELPKRDMGLLDMLLDRIRLTCRIWGRIAGR